VSLIIYYVAFVIVGDLADYLIGLIVEREFGGHASLIVFLALYALVLWAACGLDDRAQACGGGAALGFNSPLTRALRSNLPRSADSVMKWTAIRNKGTSRYRHQFFCLGHGLAFVAGGGSQTYGTASPSAIRTSPTSFPLTVRRPQRRPILQAFVNGFVPGGQEHSISLKSRLPLSKSTMSRALARLPFSISDGHLPCAVSGASKSTRRYS
jgi:hypothetical protein